MARALVGALEPGTVVLLEHDAYYKDQSHLSYEERTHINYDHPDSLDNDLFVQHLDALRAGQPVDRPVYDYAQHTRSKETLRLEPSPVVVVEGILVLSDASLRQRLDVKLYVDTDSDLRLMRRIRRDLEQRGRTFAQVRAQYYESVRPMHLAFVEPSKRFADLVIPEGGQNRVALELILSHLRSHLDRTAG